MSFYSDVCDAWATELTTEITALEQATLHLYASWSVEMMAANAGERHLSVAAGPELFTREGLTTSPADTAVTRFGITVWEDASTEVARRADDDVANRAWLQLTEDIVKRLYVTANRTLGSSQIWRLVPVSVTPDVTALVRFVTIIFETHRPVAFS